MAGRRCGGAELLPPFHSAGAERTGDATGGGISMGSWGAPPECCALHGGLGDPPGGREGGYLGRGGCRWCRWARRRAARCSAAAAG